MNPASSSDALVEWRLRNVPHRIQDSLRNLGYVFQIVTPKVAEVEVLGGIDR